MSATFTVCKVLLIDKSPSNTTGKTFYDGFQDLTMFPCKYQSFRPCFALWSNSFKAEIEVGFISTVASAPRCPSGSLNHPSKTWKSVCSPMWQEKLTLSNKWVISLCGLSAHLSEGITKWVHGQRRHCPHSGPPGCLLQGELSIPTWVFLKGIESSQWHWIWRKGF